MRKLKFMMCIIRDPVDFAVHEGFELEIDVWDARCGRRTLLRPLLKNLAFTPVEILIYATSGWFYMALHTTEAFQRSLQLLLMYIAGRPITNPLEESLPI